MTSTLFVKCPNCSLSGRVSASRAGEQATCTRCKTQFVLQAVASEAPAPVPPAPASPPPPPSVPASIPEPPISLASSPAPMTHSYCPICVSVRLEASGNPLDTKECSTCHGELLPTSAASTLVQEVFGLDPKVLPELETYSKAEPVACPQCRSSLTLIQLKGVKVDWCASCGCIWLDEGELHRLSQGRWGKPKPRRGPLDHVDESAKIALARLAEFRELEIRQDPEQGAATVLVGWDQANWYDVRGPMGTVALVAEERYGRWGDLIRNYSEQHWRSLFVLDKYRTQVLLHFERAWFIFLSKMKVRRGKGGRQIGEVQRRFNPIIRGYDLTGPDGKTFAHLRSPFWSPWTYKILRPSDGAELGSIQKQWSGWAQEYFTRGDNFSLSYGDHPWTLEQRYILLAAAISIDLDRFEHRGNE